MSLLSRNAIKQHMEYRSIVISPFEEASLNTTAYDCRLGPYFYREQPDRIGSSVFNPFDEEQVRRLWGDCQFPEKASNWMRRNGQLTNISADDHLIVIKPGETVLGHTIEFVGGRDVQVSPAFPVSWMNATTEMRARSSVGRVGITVCKCAGWGDVGYINRWTMEITNLMRDAIIPLPVGMRICQLIFYQVARTESTYAGEQGKYQADDDLKKVEAAWRPEMMLPKLYKDRDIGRFHTFLPEDFLAQIRSH